MTVSKESLKCPDGHDQNQPCGGTIKAKGSEINNVATETSIPIVIQINLDITIKNSMSTNFYLAFLLHHMSSETLNEQLDEYYVKLEEHLDRAPEEMKSFYFEYKSQDDSPAFKQPPHEQLIRRAASVFEVIFEYNQEIRPVEMNSEWGPRDITFTHLGIGFEKLLYGIYLKHNPEKYIAEIEDSDHDTPSHESAKGLVMRELPDSLTSGQRKQISLVVEIIREHRNNTVHFGLYRYYQQGLSVAFFEVAAYLLYQFGGQEFDIVEDIDKHRESQRESMVISGKQPDEPLPLE